MGHSCLSAFQQESDIQTGQSLTTANEQRHHTKTCQHDETEAKYADYLSLSDPSDLD